ncbi:unnamed protein product [Symbiodinium natans]|uniref:Uncharacterized protein n=1 Tax=Symbiodinium natans TaxID=878477 RepID=A0A812JQS0_9DINO|nr:unnamed protein product [Symbiodinium natans]
MSSLEALTRAHEDMIVRRVGILGDWMAKSHTFRGSDGQAFTGLASLLMRCMGVNLQKLGAGEEVCMHFVVPYTQDAQEDYLIFVPSLVQNPLQPQEGICSHGPECECNQTRLQLVGLVPDKVFLADPLSIFNLGLLASAEEDEHQGIEALSLAFGIPSRRIREIFVAEGYVLTRDYACKILELLARRRSRVPTILVGESGTGKTRVPWPTSAYGRLSRNCGPFWGHTATNIYVGYPKRDHNFDNHPYELSVYHISALRPSASLHLDPVSTQLTLMPRGSGNADAASPGV